MVKPSSNFNQVSSGVIIEIEK